MADQGGRGGATPQQGMSGDVLRVVSFTDAVVAIAITLLVFPLTGAQLTDQGMADQLRALWPQLRSFALSFLVVAVFWLDHYAIFSCIARVDRRLLTLNLLFVLSVAFLPFPTKVAGEHRHSTTAAVLYAGSVVATGLFSAAIWHRATSRGLLRPHVGPHRIPLHGAAVTDRARPVLAVDPGGAGQPAGGPPHVVAVLPGLLAGREEGGRT